MRPTVSKGFPLQLTYLSTLFIMIVHDVLPTAIHSQSQAYVRVVDLHWILQVPTSPSATRAIHESGAMGIF